MAKTKMRDLVILLPGITGSVLQKDGKDVWALSSGALFKTLTTLGGSLQDLRLPAHEPGTIPVDDGVRATALMRGFHGIFGLWKIDGYDAAIRLVTDNFEVVGGLPDDGNPRANFIQFPYDWRRSNRESAAKLKLLVDQRLHAWRNWSQCQDAKVILIAHSMGGLVARYYLEVLEGWPDCRALVTLGTPYRGALNAIDFLANGYKKTFVDLTQVIRSLPSVYELMPIYKAVKVNDQWCRVAETVIPKIDAARAEDALRFHREIEAAVQRHRQDVRYVSDGYKMFPVVGVAQPTFQSAALQHGRVIAGAAHPDWIDEALQGGDGTVPRVSATPIELSDSYRETFFVERHSSLQNNEYVLDDLRERLRQMQAVQPQPIRGAWRADVKRAAIGLEVDDLYLPGEPVRLNVRLTGAGGAGDLVATVRQLTGAQQQLDFEFRADESGHSLALDPLAPGRYRATVRSKQGGPTAATAVRDVFEVAD